MFTFLVLVAGVVCIIKTGENYGFNEALIAGCATVISMLLVYTFIDRRVNWKRVFGDSD